MPVGTKFVTWGYSGLCGNAVILFPREKWTGNLVVDRSIVYFHHAERLAGIFHQTPRLDPHTTYWAILNSVFY